MRVANGLHICSADRITLFGSFSTGQGAPNAFGSLLNGATLYPIDIKREGIAGLADRIITERITIYLSAATIFRQFVHSLSGQEEFPDLRMIRLANEQVRKSDIELYKRHFAPNCIFANFLSGTETGNLCQFYIDKETEISGSFVPVGYSVDDMEIKVLNDSGEEVGFDHVGEIAVTSPYLALGYWRRPDLTQEGFLADPAGGSKKTYRTGDMGLMTPDGCLQHLGRKAFRVKIRGFRVELEEVEASLAQDPTVKEAAVDAREDEAGNTQLIAYIVCAEERKPTVSALRRFLGATLPEYMVPSVFVFLNSLPLTPLGKVDRRSLPPPGRDRPELDTVFVGPGTEVEASLAEIWQQVLHVDSVGIHDNFFDLGGNSVRLAEVNRKASELLRTEISLIEMFRYPTISSLAQLLTPTVQQKEQDVLEQSYDRAKIRRALRAGRSTNRKEPDQ
jgi:non-ribosomal peptide synthetase component F